MEQLAFAFPEPKTFVVGCRVKGEAGTQVYHITAMNYVQATQTVREAVYGASPILTLVKGR